MIKKSIRDYDFSIKDLFNHNTNKKETNYGFLSKLGLEPSKNDSKQLKDDELIQYSNDKPYIRVGTIIYCYIHIYINKLYK